MHKYFLYNWALPLQLILVWVNGSHISYFFNILEASLHFLLSVVNFFHPLIFCLLQIQFHYIQPSYSGPATGSPHQYITDDFHSCTCSGVCSFYRSIVVSAVAIIMGLIILLYYFIFTFFDLFLFCIIFLFLFYFISQKMFGNMLNRSPYYEL